MKTRNIILGICLLGMLGFISCESGKVKNTNTTKAFGSLAEFYQDSVYLSFEGNLMNRKSSGGIKTFMSLPTNV